MSDNKKLEIEVGLKPDSSSVKKTSDEIGKQLDSQIKDYSKKTKQYLEELNRYKIKIEHDTQTQILVDAAKISKENDRKAAEHLKETYSEKIQVAKDTETKIEDAKYIERQKYLDKHYSTEQRKFDKYQTQQRKIKENNRKQEEKQVEETTQSAFKKEQAVANESERQRKFRWTVKTKDFEEDVRRKSDIRRKYQSIGAAIGGGIGGSAGGGVGGAAGAFIGSAITGGDVIGGAIGLAMAALTAAITHLTDVIEEDTGTGYTADAIHEDPNKLNALLNAGEVLDIKKADIMSGLKTIYTGFAGLDLQENGSFGRMTESGQQFMQNAAKLLIPLTEKGKARSVIDVYRDFMDTSRDQYLESQGISHDTANLIRSEYLKVPYEVLPRLQGSKFNDTVNQFMTDMPLTQTDVNNETKIQQGKNLKKKQVSYNTGRNVIRGGINFVDKNNEGYQQYYNMRHPDQATNNNSGVANTEQSSNIYSSVEDYLFSKEGKSRQGLAENSKRDPNLVTDISYLDRAGKFHQRYAVGLYQINTDTANSAASREHFGGGVSVDQLKDPKVNEAYRDFIIKDGLEYIKHHYPDMMLHPNQLLKGELAYYNGGEENLKQFYASGQSADDGYISKIVNNITINVDAKGNTNSQDIADKTVKALPVYNNQTSVK